MWPTPGARDANSGSETMPFVLMTRMVYEGLSSGKCIADLWPLLFPPPHLVIDTKGLMGEADQAKNARRVSASAFG